MFLKKRATGYDNNETLLKAKGGINLKTLKFHTVILKDTEYKGMGEGRQRTLTDNIATIRYHI